jgi:hypothetical protein
MKSNEQPNHETRPGASPRPRVNLTINISRASGEKKSKLTSDIEKRLPPGLLTGLKKHEDALFAWLAQDSRNPYLFATDPLKALQAAVPGIDAGLLAKIQQYRQLQKTQHMAVPDVDLNKLTVKVK